MSEEENKNPLEDGSEENEEQLHGAIAVSEMYENWFLDYASYVIMERAVPALADGLKPVQRRILHAMREMDDGRFHKVANIIGQTMQYHPHGDAAIGDALVNMGQKELMIETQGNWGDVRTGDSAAAARYIEARLSKFALEVAFNPTTTEWQLSYDGRKREPVNLPMKFPLVLAHGAEGIAVGLATKIMPHNFIELIDGSIDILKGKKTNILPDFPTGGKADFRDYSGGLKGSRIRVRATIDVIDKKNLVIKDIPFGTTTTSLIESIIKANDKGKIKIKKVTDNTAAEVEIFIELPSGVSPDVTLDALYAFTDCEVSISPNCCVIYEDKPQFLDVNEILRISTGNTKALLKKELEIKLGDLLDKWHFSSLEKIFIENRIYRDIEECETWEAVIEAIDKGLDPFKSLLRREVTEEDIVRLTEIKIKRISKYDSFKADELLKRLEDDMAQVQHDLEHLTDFAIKYFKSLKEKYGKGKERKTQIKSFDTIEASQVAANNVKLYVNREEGFIGYGIKKDEFVCDCSDIDDVIVFRKDGKMVVTRISEKVFVGKDIIHVAIWSKGDERTIYNMIYRGAKGISFGKRFAVTSITRDKEYNLITGDNNSKVLYFTANPNGESEVVAIHLTQGSRARKKNMEFDFAEIAIKGRGSKGNIVTRYPVRKIEQKEVGSSTIGGMNIWLDEIVGRLNTEERGKFLGEFDTGDAILVIYKDGSYEQTSFELTNHYKMEDILKIEKFNAETVVSVVYLDGERKKYFVKRFKIETSSIGQRFPFITEHRSSDLKIISFADHPIISFKEVKGKQKEEIERLEDLSEFIDIKGWKAIGNQLGEKDQIKKLQLKEEINETLPEPEITHTDDEEEEVQLTMEDDDLEEVNLKEEEAHEEEEENTITSGTVVEWDMEEGKKEVKKADNKPAPDKKEQGTLF